MSLRPHQITAARSLLDTIHRHGVALDGSDTGTGKTFVACEVARQLDLPTLAVVPKVSLTSWRRVAEAVGTSFSILNWEMIRTGRTPYGKWATPTGNVYWSCEACFESSDAPDPGPCRNNSNGHVWTRHRHRNKSPQFEWHPGVRFLMFDEIHRAGGRDSQNAAMVIAAKRQHIKTLAISATPAITPIDMKALGYLFGMHQLTGDAGFYPWLRGWGYRPRPMNQGWLWAASEAKQRAVMIRIRDILFPGLGVRVRTEDIPDFPGRTVQAILLDLEAPQQLETLYREMKESLDRLRARKTQDKDPEGILTKQLRARQEVELLKVPLAVERAQDLLASGYSVGIFVNFSETLAELRRRLECDCFIDGTQTGDPAARQNHIDRFQADEARLMVLNAQAGSETLSLHDLHGVHQRVGLVFPGTSALRFRQLVGRFQREGGKSDALYQVLLAANTCEEQIARKLLRKLGNLDSLLDGDLLPDDFTLPK